MKCLSCGSLNASEVNISWNISETDASKPEPEYTGETEYGDCSDGIGTWCPDCERTTLTSDWKVIVTAYMAPPHPGRAARAHPEVGPVTPREAVAVLRAYLAEQPLIYAESYRLRSALDISLDIIAGLIQADEDKS